MVTVVNAMRTMLEGIRLVGSRYSSPTGTVQLLQALPEPARQGPVVALAQWPRQLMDDVFVHMVPLLFVSHLWVHDINDSLKFFLPLQKEKGEWAQCGHNHIGVIQGGGNRIGIHMRFHFKQFFLFHNPQSFDTIGDSLLEQLL
jgi:hypothetical protein